MKAARITYTDDTEETVPITMRHQIKAEDYLRESGLGTAQNSPIQFGLYMVYAAKRISGQSLPSFEEWVDTVANIDVDAPKQQ